MSSAPIELRRQSEVLVDAVEPIQSIRSEQSAPTGPVLVCLADVQPEPVRWLWPWRIALGKMTLLAGDPGLGKSFITLDMAARVSAGRPWPDSPLTANAAGGVVLLNAEDDAADTVRPRLDAARADVTRIKLLAAVRRRIDDDRNVELPFNLQTDLAVLEEAIRQTHDCRLVVIDPVTAYLGGSDSHKNAEIRALLAPLADLAARHCVAMVMVTHLNKNAVGPAIYRSMGSLAFTAAARAVWAVTKDQENPSRRFVLPAKNNMAADVLGLAYSIESDGTGSDPVVVWEPEPVSLTADDALAADRAVDDSGGAGDWLREALGDGKMPAADVLRQGRSNGFSDKALRRAFKAIGGRPRREGFGAGGTWYWSLPEPIDALETPIDVIHAPSPETGNNAINGSNGGDRGEI